MVFEWNLEVADNSLRLTNKALLLAFNYFDRHLSRAQVPKSELQLVSTACLWVASKVCESECPVAKGAALEWLIGIDRRCRPAAHDTPVLVFSPPIAIAKEQR
jgi:hypothetical protein